MPHWAEDAARSYLERKGWRFVTGNYRLRLGEVDLVMQDGPTLVFVEVRQRGSRRFGGAAVTIDSRKLARVRRAAEHFAQQHAGDPPPPMRIDAVLVDGPRGACRLRHLRGVA